jgi:hypothetical protein
MQNQSINNGQILMRENMCIEIIYMLILIMIIIIMDKCHSFLYLFLSLTLISTLELELNCSLTIFLINSHLYKIIDYPLGQVL